MLRKMRVRGDIEIIAPDGRSWPAERRRSGDTYRPYAATPAPGRTMATAPPAERRRRPRTNIAAKRGDRLDLEV